MDGGPDSSPDTSPETSIPDATTDRDPPPPGCLTPDEPLKNPEKCLVDSFGSFVSPSGDDANDGTKAKPYKTIGKALGSNKTRLVVCEGTYPEALDIGRDAEIYGGVACTFDKAGKAAAIDSGKAVGLAVSKGSVSLSNINVTAKDGVDPGESSIGIAIASGVTFKMVGGVVVAGTGAPGGDGTPTSNYSAVAQNDPKIKGNDGAGNTGGAPQSCAMLACVENVGVPTEGGAGGLGSNLGGGPAGNGKTTVPGGPATAGNGGLWDGAACGNGRPGAEAPPSNGGTGAPTPGTIDAGKWTPSRGTPGTTARPGQGGGGGSGGRDTGGANAGGGGGGCGGCGGGKGQGGLSGGSSFAVLSTSATVTLENVTLKAGAGGKGGKGGDGQVGQLGGLSGQPAASGIGCSGGLGGTGGQGGGGGGGAGGHSVAVAFTGTKPTLKSITPEVATAAASGGDPGTSGAGATAATAGAPGKASADLAL